MPGELVDEKSSLGLGRETEKQQQRIAMRTSARRDQVAPP